MKDFTFFKQILPIILIGVFVSCNLQIPVSQMIKDYNHEFSSDFVDEEEKLLKKAQKRETLLPKEVYEIPKGQTIKIEAELGFLKYNWSITDSNGKKMNFDVTEDQNVISINGNFYKAGNYKLVIVTENVLGTKYTDTSIVVVY